eukprot:6481475-Amphidinium_carterae.1
MWGTFRATKTTRHDESHSNPVLEHFSAQFGMGLHYPLLHCFPTKHRANVSDDITGIVIWHLNSSRVPAGLAAHTARTGLTAPASANSIRTVDEHEGQDGTVPQVEHLPTMCLLKKRPRRIRFMVSAGNTSAIRSGSPRGLDGLPLLVEIVQHRIVIRWKELAGHRRQASVDVTGGSMILPTSIVFSQDIISDIMR